MRTLKDLANDMETQDNRGTASPMLILLQVKKMYVAHDEFNHGTETKYVEHISGDYMHADTREELINRLIENGYEKHEIFDNEIKEYQEGFYWQTENVFFSDKGYEEHMRLNSHNYRNGEVRSYGIHAFRNPEMKLIFETINNAR